MSKIGELIVTAVAPVLKEVGKEKLVELLDKVHAKNPETHRTVLTSLYGPIDLQLEGITKETKTKIDNVFVDGLKEAIEESAEKHGVQLQNLDSD